MDGLEILAKRFIKLTYRAVGEGLAPPLPANITLDHVTVF
jgi:hypothetical protein